MLLNHLILCHPLLLLPSVFPSIRVFSNESALCIRWPKYWSFSFNISPSNECSGLISFRVDWLDLLAVQGTLKSSPTPQFKNINSLALSFVYSPTLTTIHDHWKNHQRSKPCPPHWEHGVLTTGLPGKSPLPPSPDLSRKNLVKAHRKMLGSKCSLPLRLELPGMLSCLLSHCIS